MVKAADRNTLTYAYAAHPWLLRWGQTLVTSLVGYFVGYFVGWLLRWGQLFVGVRPSVIRWGQTL